MKALPRAESTPLAVSNATSQNQKTNRQRKRWCPLLIVGRRSVDVTFSHRLPSWHPIVFGWELRNTRLLADNYAKAGFYYYIPDVHEGDSLPFSFLQNVEPPLKDQKQASLIDKAKNAAIISATLRP